MTNFYILLLLVLTSYNSYAQEISIDDIKERVLMMEKKFSIKIFIDTLPTITWDIEYEVAQAQDYHSLYKYLALFDKEFSKYPISFLQKSDLYGVAIVKNLALDFGHTTQVRTVIPDPYKEIMFFNFLAGNHDSAYQKHIIHHEFYHMLGEQFNGKLRWNDPVWNSFNVSNEVYGTHTLNGSEPMLINHSIKGFVGLYSLSALWEDKAEIFAVMFTPEHHPQFKTWLSQDEVLATKVEYLQNFLKGIDLSFTPEYWEQLHD